MTDKVQLSTQASTRMIRRRIALLGSRSASTIPATIPADVGFLPAWFKHDPSLGEGGARVHLNWGAISGLALSLAVSASAWAGVAWIVTRVWR
jgi:hypothetical protein